ncbi:MAG TPA: fasciclin domain-containing protein [Stellaceae bacterium]|nr:fasciclin domain-containing protein [Stellaceae bacterium]
MIDLKALGTTALIGFAIAGSAFAADNPMVGGAPMFANKNIIQNAINSKDHTTLVAAVKAGGLVDTLEGAGPFTVFAPTNAAFAALPPGTVDTLLKPENKATLDKVLTYHVVPGRLDTKTLDQQIMHGGGRTSLKTVEGDTLTVTGSGKNLWITDAKGNTAKVTIADVYQSNGVILVVDKVLMPK